LDIVKSDEVFLPASDQARSVGSLLMGEQSMSLPTTSLRAAIDTFNAAALRGCDQALERMRAEEHGGSAIFAPEQ